MQMKQLTKTKHIYLSKNNISDTGTAHIFTALRVNNSLEQLVV